MNLLEKNKPLINFISAILLFLFSSLPGELIAIAFDINIKTAAPTTIYTIKLISNFIIIFCLFLLFKKSLINDLKKLKSNLKNIIKVSIKYWTIGLVVMMLSNILITLVSPVKIANNEENIREIIKTVPLISFFLTTVTAPIMEELIFRKAFKDIIPDNIAYILTSGIIFGLCHIVFSATSFYDYLYLIPYSALGISFAIIYVKTDNVYGSIIVHMLHNGIITILQIFGTGMILL